MQRYEIVNGVVEVEGVTNETAKEGGQEQAPEGTTDTLTWFISASSFCYVQSCLVLTYEMEYSPNPCFMQRKVYQTFGSQQ